MISAGIDVGAKTIKVVLLKDRKIQSKSLILAGIDMAGSTKQALNEALDEAKLSFQDIDIVVSTGAGRKEVSFAKKELTSVSADAKGIVFLLPSVRTVVDVGAEESRAIRCDASGRVTNFAINEKCAAGAGVFAEAMARALGVNLEEFSKLALKSDKTNLLNTQCVIFAESEVVSLIHAGTSKEDISRVVHNTLARRISSMVRAIRLEKDIALIGGMAKNVGFIDSLSRDLQVTPVVPAEPEYVSAIGAALFGVT